MDKDQLKTLTDEMVNNLMPPMEEYEQRATPMASAESLMAQERAQLEEYLNPETFSKLVTSATARISQQLPHVVSKEEWDTVHNELLAVKDAASAFTEDQNSEDPIILADALGISNESLEAIYKLVLHDTAEQHYEEATSVISLLLILNPGITAFWTCLGFIMEKQHYPVVAEQYYLSATEIDPDDPEAWIRLAKLHHSQGHKDEAKEALDEAKSRLANLEEDSPWHESYKRMERQL